MVSTDVMPGAGQSPCKHVSISVREWSRKSKAPAVTLWACWINPNSKLQTYMKEKTLFVQVRFSMAYRQRIPK